MSHSGMDGRLAGRRGAVPLHANSVAAALEACRFRRQTLGRAGGRAVQGDSGLYGAVALPVATTTLEQSTGEWTWLATGHGLP